MLKFNLVRSMNHVINKNTRRVVLKITILKRKREMSEVNVSIYGPVASDFLE